MLYFLVVIVVFLSICVAYLLFKNLVAKENLGKLHDFETQNVNLANDLQKVAEQNIVAQTNLTQQNIRIDDFLEEKEYLQNKIEELQVQITKLSNNNAQNLQKIADFELSKKDSEEVKKQYMQMTQASIVKAGNDLSNKLLDDHKRESQTSKKESEKIINQTTEKIYNQFGDICKSMEVLNDKVKKVEVVERSLLNPSGAGILSEITLSNIFKNSNLIENIDYFMQYNVKGENANQLRPDAVVFTPQGAIIIDSKASKFFLEIEQAENEEQKNQLKLNLKKTFNDHLKSLVSKNYKQAVEEQIIQSKNPDLQYNAVYMFFPSDQALSKLLEIDASFMEKAFTQAIYPVGPSGLINALLNARLVIFKTKQDENLQKIMQQVQGLIKNISTMHKYSQKLGNSAKMTLEHYDKFAGSFNRNLISKLKKFEKLGLENNSEIKQLDRFEVNENKTEIIDVTLDDSEIEQADINLIKQN